MMKAWMTTLYHTFFDSRLDLRVQVFHILASAAIVGTMIISLVNFSPGLAYLPFWLTSFLAFYPLPYSIIPTGPNATSNVISSPSPSSLSVSFLISSFTLAVTTGACPCFLSSPLSIPLLC